MPELTTAIDATPPPPKPQSSPEAMLVVARALRRAAEEEGPESDLHELAAELEAKARAVTR